ncbi:MFS transporter [Roseibium aquae]|uniref:MFS transporter n=1 Tax=Roseibium aquae TaxID=1323746 RepID=A0A916TMB9_9HYPH|nr:MFS transporter [Roseibium aquae]GGB56618.1 MFS transporter [Roseibium aquae]
MTVRTDTDFPLNDSLAKRNALLLAFAQAMGGALASIVIATGPLVGYMMLSQDKSLATLPVSAMVLGTAFGTLPAGMIMRRFGRRAGFMGASLLSAVSGLVASFAVFQDSFVLFVLACWAGGFAGAFVQQYRFAAADTATDAFKPKAISWVLAGGVLAGVVGPQTVIFTKDLFDPIMFAGTYLAQAGLSLLAFFVVSFLRIPRPPKQTAKSGGRPMGEIMKQPRFLVAVACGICSYALMSLVMTATPLAMIGCGFSENQAALGIQWHVIAMFGPSFFTGNLIARFGKETIVSVGLLLLAGCSAVALMGIELAHFWTALVLLGLGWNFGFIGATAMLTDTYRPEERNMVQATNDFLVFGFVAAASFSSGALLSFFGWETINMLVFPFVVLCFALLGWLWMIERKPAVV